MRRYQSQSRAETKDIEEMEARRGFSKRFSQPFYSSTPEEREKIMKTLMGTHGETAMTQDELEKATLLMLWFYDGGFSHPMLDIMKMPKTAGQGPVHLPHYKPGDCIGMSDEAYGFAKGMPADSLMSVFNMPVRYSCGKTGKMKQLLADYDVLKIAEIIACEGHNYDKTYDLLSKGPNFVEMDGNSYWTNPARFALDSLDILYGDGYNRDFGKQLESVCAGFKEEAGQFLTDDAKSKDGNMFDKARLNEMVFAAGVASLYKHDYRSNKKFENEAQAANVLATSGAAYQGIRYGMGWTLKFADKEKQ